MPERTSPTPTDEPMAQALDWLVRLESGSAADLDAFQHWLQQAPAHAEAFALAERAWNSQLVGAAADLAHTRLAAPAKPRQGWRWQRWASAASLLLALAIGLFGDLPTQLRADWSTARGEQRNLTLEDGSRILLGSHSALAQRFDTTARSTRLLRGEAYFEVAVGQPRPFLIEAGEAHIRVVGTAFAVRYLADTARVSVSHGVVEVSDRQGASQRLTAGQQVLIDAGGLGQPHPFDPDLALAWTKGRLVFEEQPLGEVVDDLRRHYPGLVLLVDRPLAAELISGNYRLDQPERTLETLAELTHARVSRFPGGLWLHR